MNFTKKNREIITDAITLSGAPLEWKETMGEGIKIGIIDTGIDYNHEDLKDAIVDAVSFIGKSSFDDNGHGTHVAGIIGARKNDVGVIGVAPKSSLYIVKAFNKDGIGDNRAIIEGINWLIKQKVDIINMSFSSKEYDKTYYDSVKNAYNNGIVMVCAAGNDGDVNSYNTIGYPALFNETIAVTALDINKHRADFSSTGSKADIAAIGKDVYSTYPNNAYQFLSGTSMAAPIISGCAAILQKKCMNRFNRKLTPNEMKTIMGIYAEDLGAKGKDPLFGCGFFSFGRIEEKESFSFDEIAYRLNTKLH